MRIGTAILGIAVLALATAGCGAGTDPAPSRSSTDAAASNPAPSPSPSEAADASFVLSSADFADGGLLPESAKASAFGGQCEGANLNPELTWTGAPEGTVAFAITVIDISADNFVHWTKTDIPATTTGVPAGGADALAGIGGQTGHSSGAYFGPCPPGTDHNYVFTVYALDATLGLDANFAMVNLNIGLKDHTLAQASITGLASHTG